jgi:endoglucanase
MVRRVLAVLTALAVAALGLFALGSSNRVSAAPLPGLSVSGNHLVNASGQTVVLHGVDRSGTEYMCVQGGGIFDGPSDATSVAAMASWGINAVRIPLNEDCWLGINGANPGGAIYQSAIEAYVTLLHSAGIYAILDLQWTAPGSVEATYQENMADYSNSVPFWASVGAAFKNDPATLFDLFNEPNNIGIVGCVAGAPAGCATAVAESAAGNGEGAFWWCAYVGTGCITNQNSAKFGNWQIASMQDMLTAVRGAGASNVVMVGADQFANDPSAWLANVPVDPDHQLAMSFHVYNFNYPCVSLACWNSELLPIAASYPIISGEIGESDGSASFIDGYMAWADANGVSYLAWTWDTWGCGDSAVLISSYTGTACAGYGAGYQAHLATLAGSTPTPTSTPTATPTSGPTSTPTPSLPTPTPTSTPTAVPTPTPTAVPTATPTPRPTSTPRPTATPRPSATPTPTPTPEPSFTETITVNGHTCTITVTNGVVSGTCT